MMYFLVFSFLLAMFVTGETCSEFQKFHLLVEVENCQNVTNILGFESQCERIEYLTNNCTKPLEQCYDLEIISKIRGNYLENLIFDTWAALLDVERLSTKQKSKLKKIWNVNGNIKKDIYEKMDLETYLRTYEPDPFDYEKT